MSAALAVAAGLTGAVHPDVMTTALANTAHAKTEDRKLRPWQRRRVAVWVVNQTIRNCLHRQ